MGTSEASWSKQAEATWSKRATAPYEQRSTFRHKKIANQSRQAGRPDFHAILTKNISRLSDIRKAIHSLTGQVGVFLLLYRITRAEYRSRYSYYLNIIRFSNLKNDFIPVPVTSFIAFHFDADPDPVSQNDADPDLQHCVSETQFCQKNWQFKKRASREKKGFLHNYTVTI